jgi:tetratricopeptide (TPR) repeat protein
MKVVVDRSAPVRVGSRMARMLSIALAGSLALGAGACGGKNKGATTTPSGGGSAKAGGGEGHMSDLEPDSGSGAGGDTGGGNAGAAPTGNDGGGAAPMPGGGTANNAPPPPAQMITPANLDPSPQQSAQAVNQHLDAGWLALKGPQVDPDLALREAQAALSVDATSVDAVALMAHAYIDKHLYDTAEVILDMLLKDRKDAASKNAKVYYAYGLIYDKTARDALAVKSYETAIALDGNYASPRINLGIHQLQNKQYKDAIETYSTAQKLGVVDAITWTDLGDAYRGHSGDFDPGTPDRNDMLLKAKDSYEHAVNTDPRFAPAYYDLGLLYLDGDPFPNGQSPMDTLDRLGKAKSYFDTYAATPGYDKKLSDDRHKDVDKQIKREQKKRNKKPAKAAPAPAPGANQ